MAGELLTPAVTSALEEAGPAVAQAIGLDVVGGVVSVAAVGEAGLNPVADVAAPVADAAAAAKDAQATAKTAELAKAVLESPAGKAALKAAGETAEQFMKKLEVEGPKALKELLETPAATGLKAELQALAKNAGEVWDRLPGAAKSGVLAAGAGLSAVAGAISNNTFVKGITDAATEKYDEAFHHPQIAPEGSDRYQDLAKGGITGRVVGQDGANATLQVGRDRVSISNLSEKQLETLNAGDLVNIRPTAGGRAEVDVLTPAAQAHTPAHAVAQPHGRA